MTTQTPRPLRRRVPLAALAAAGLALGAAGTVHADSIAYVQGGNVWIAAPDGSNRYQVTRDGTAERPYSSPSQADDGTLVASQGSEIVRMRQNGSVLNRMDPPPLTNSVSHPVDGAPSAVAISPDGSKIAYSLVDVQCPVGVPGCDARPATAITPADRMEPTGNLYTFGSSWVTNTRILTFAGFLHQVNTYDVGDAADVHWFDDQELAGEGNSTDQSDGEINRQGSYVATIRGYGNDRTVMWLKLRGNVQTGSRAAGTLLLPDVDQGCVSTAASDMAGPTWSPSGRSLAWREAGAIHVWDDIGRCAGASSKPVIADASEPDWGPADVNPGPREGEIPPPGPPAPTPPGPKPGDGKQPGTKPSQPQGAGKPKLKLATTVRLGTALRRGFRVRVSGAKSGTIALVAKQGKRKLASGKGKVPASGRATVTLRFTAAAKGRLASRKRISLVVSGRGATRTVTLKR